MDLDRESSDRPGWPERRAGCKTRPNLADGKPEASQFSNFELNLQSRGAVLRTTETHYTTPEGTERVRLTDTVVEFEPAAPTATGFTRLLGAWMGLPGDKEELVCCAE